MPKPTMPRDGSVPVYKKDMPVGVKIISILYFIAAAFLVLYIIFIIVILALLGTQTEFLPPELTTEASQTVIIVVAIIMLLFFAGMAVLDFFIGLGLWRGKKWARIVALIFSGLGIFGALITVPLMIAGMLIDPISVISFVLSLGVNLFIFIYLLASQEVKKAFA
ncbi:hypothetical protein KY341_04980 [Candidatus Woesearchaeota archaeon]|nr:hypothetical protein [Candidatus Woesearchaeota archaeon]